MISEAKPNMDLISELDLQLDQQLPTLLTCSQGTTVSDSWFIDNNPLMHACEQNADFSWKYNTSELAHLDSFLKSNMDDANSGNRSDTDVCIEDPTEDLVFLSTVVMSPVSNPPTSPSCKHEANDAKAHEGMICEADTIINEILKPTDEENARMKIEEIENWLLMASSSQGNEYLSQSQKEDDLPTAEVVDEVEAEESMQSDADFLIMESSSSPVASADVTVVATSSFSDDTNSPTSSSATTKARKKPTSRTSKEIKGKVEKKRNQNKEAARRYRDKKKIEAEEYYHRREELEMENRKKRDELRDKLKEREILLNLWKQCVSSKSNANFTVHFPSWMS